MIIQFVYFYFPNLIFSLYTLLLGEADIAIITAGLILSAVLYYLKVDTTSIESLLKKAGQSWVSFVVIVVFFELAHVDSIQEINIDSFKNIFISFSVTFVAKKYGIKASILFHIIWNSLIVGYKQAVLNYYGYQNDLFCYGIIGLIVITTF